MKEETYEWPVDNTGLFSDVFSLLGRVSRLEFLIVFAVVFGCSVGSVLFLPSLEPIVSLVGGIALLGEGAKRMHDFDVSAKWLIVLVLITIASSFLAEQIPNLVYVYFAVYWIVVILLCTIPGTKGINRYGTNPTRSYREQTLEAGYPDLEV